MSKTYPKFKLLITPPKHKSLKTFVETIEFTEEMINENRLDSESDAQTIEYMLNEIVSEYQQAFHEVKVFDESQWGYMPPIV